MTSVFDLSSILDQLKAIWPNHENVTSDDLQDHNNDFFVSNVSWLIKWKVMTSVLDLSMF